MPEKDVYICEALEEVCGLPELAVKAGGEIKDGCAGDMCQLNEQCMNKHEELEKLKNVGSTPGGEA